MTEISYGAFEQAADKNFHVGRVSPVRLVVVHCTAGAESTSGTGAEGVMHMFASQNSRQASATVTCDQNSIARSLHDKDTPFAAVHANSCGLHEELVGMPNQTRAQWMDPISKATIDNGARVARDWCNLYGLRKGTLTDAQLLAILRDPHGTSLTGITTHAQVQRVWPSTGHTDPGPNFPMDYFLQQVNSSTHQDAKPAPLVSNPFPLPHVTQDPRTYIQGGSRGDGVKFVQWALGLHPVDGVAGKQYAASLVAWKRKAGYPAPAQDDVVGPGTLAKLAAIKHHAS